MKHQQKIEDLLGEVGNFVIQQESVKLSLIPAKLLKKQESYDEYEQYSINYGLSDKNEDYKEGSSDENEDEQESSGEESSTKEPDSNFQEKGHQTKPTWRVESYLTKTCVYP